MDFANTWEEHRGIKREPGINRGYSTWERVKRFFVKPTWTPWRKQKKEIGGVARNITDDYNVMYSKFRGRPEFSPQFAADKLKADGWSTEEIRKLGVRFKDIK